MAGYLYVGQPIESRIWSIERRYFHDQNFKVMSFFDAEYLKRYER